MAGPSYIAGLDPEAFELLVQRRGVYREELRGPLLVPVASLQGGQYQGLLEVADALLERQPLAGKAEGIARQRASRCASERGPK